MEILLFLGVPILKHITVYGFFGFFFVIDILTFVITAKRQAFKAWKTGKGTRASYHAAKRMLAKKLTRKSTRILTQSLQNYTALQTS